MQEIQSAGAQASAGTCSCGCEPNQDYNHVANNARSSHADGCKCSCLFKDDRNNHYNGAYQHHH